ncbi:hypothetical protein OYC64_021839 [Pagothenia borchgrevinki]|uniref:G-protein coupled receptors family 1 profile domain-containing protein n=1 Tax=Pagothenia borchgrevinki TaxID=8213 RepID=A0ABD2G236_PAGBO
MGNIVEEGMNTVIVSHYNHSGKWERPRSSGACKMAVLLFICCLIVLENVTVLLALWRNKRFHSRMYFLIGNLALSDLLAGVAYVVNIFTSGRNTFFLTPVQWLAREGSMFVALSASTFSLLAIGIERHMTMVRLRPCETAGRGRLLGLLAACWLVSVLLSALPSLGWNCLDNMASCSTVLPLYAKSYVAFCISVFSALLVAIIILYIRIYRLVTSSGRRVSSQSERSLALLRTVVIVLGVFVMCWTPLFLLLLLDVGCSPDKCPVLFQVDWFIALAVLNSALNPLIYTLSSREMRAAFFRQLCCCQTSMEHTGTAVLGNPNLGTVIPTAENSKTSAGGGSGPGKTTLQRGKVPTPMHSEIKNGDPSATALPPPSGPADLLSAVLVKALPPLNKF